MPTYFVGANRLRVTIENIVRSLRPGGGLEGRLDLIVVA
jgi:hypothetical protein